MLLPLFRMEDKMEVYTGNGIVWNPVRNKILCDFNKGPYTTLDVTEQEILKKVGCIADFEDELVIIEDDENEEQTEPEIRAKAKELGISHWHNKNIDKLIKEISEV